MELHIDIAEADVLAYSCLWHLEVAHIQYNLMVEDQLLG